MIKILTFGVRGVDGDPLLNGNQQLNGDVGTNELTSANLISAKGIPFQQLLLFVGEANDGDLNIDAGETAFNLSDMGANDAVTSLAVTNGNDPLRIRAHGLTSAAVLGDLSAHVRFDNAIGFGLDNSPDGETAAHWLNRGDSLTFELAQVGGVAQFLAAVSFVVNVRDGGSESVVLDFDGDVVKQAAGQISTDGINLGLIANGTTVSLDFVARSIRIGTVVRAMTEDEYQAFLAGGLNQLTIGSLSTATQGFAIGSLSIASADAAISGDVINAHPTGGVTEGTAGGDIVVGSAAADAVTAGAGDDAIFGGDGNDTIDAGADDDLVEGGGGDDTVIGGDGDDVLIGGAGDDVITGGAGADVYVFRSLEDLTANTDHITDFEPGLDTIDLSAIGGLSFIGRDAFTGMAGQVRFEILASTTEIQIDADGDSVLDDRLIIDNGRFIFSEVAPGTLVLQGAFANSAPVVAVGLADQAAAEDVVFSFAVPAGAFSDADNDSLTYSATLANGDPLPGWLSFHADTRTFAGTPEQGDIGQLDVRVVATDAAGESVADIFRIDIADSIDAPAITGLTATSTPAPSATVTRISVGSNGEQANGASFNPVLSQDGRYILFSSDATNLGPNDTNTESDLFVHDRIAGTTTLVSRSTNGAAAGVGAGTAISPDGRYVVFNSVSSDIVAGDTNDANDVFVFDRVTDQIERVSISSLGLQGNADASDGGVSADGRYVVFTSDASNLVAGDLNGVPDIFVRDRFTGETTRVSVSSTGGEANSFNDTPSISADGRFVLFESRATNLGPTGPNDVWVLYLHDRSTGETSRVSPEGFLGVEVERNSLSADGRYLVFAGSRDELGPSDEVYRYDRVTGETVLVSQTLNGEVANGSSYSASISADGRYVSFFSTASNLAVGGGGSQIFVRDMDAGYTARISGNLGNPISSVSANGPLVAFSSHASNLVSGDTNGVSDIFVGPALPTAPGSVDFGLAVQTDAIAGAQLRVDWNSDGVWDHTQSLAPGAGALTLRRDFAPGTDAVVTFLVDNGAGQATSLQAHVQYAAASLPVSPLQLVSRNAAGVQGDFGSYVPVLSQDGRYVAFYSDATNLIADDSNAQTDIFIRDRQTGEVARVSVASNGAAADSASYFASISADGQVIAFESFATSLANDLNGAFDIYVHDRADGQTTRVSRAADGGDPNADSTGATISADGRFVAYRSAANNIVAGDTNGIADIFLFDRLTEQTSRVSVGGGGQESIGAFGAYGASLSADGRFITYESDATNLVLGDTNNAYDVFIHDRQTGVTELISHGLGGAAANDSSYGAIVSADGRYISFSSNASNLVAGDTNNTSDVFVHDRQTGETSRVSVGTGGIEANGSGFHSMSADGRLIAFVSTAGSLGVPVDQQGLFVHDRVTGVTRLVSINASDFSSISISADGSFVSFESANDALVAGDTNLDSDIFIYDLRPPPTTMGDAGIDVLIGNANANAMDGAGGDDMLRGLLGADTLTGGDGADRFIYGAPGEGNDVITDFVSGEDKIVIDLFGFGGGLVAGGAVTLLASPNPTGGGAEPAFRYNTSTGELYWDADGAGDDPGVPIARLIGAPLLTTSDFILCG